MDSIFDTDSSLNTRLLAAVLVSLALLAVDHRYHYLNTARSLLSTLTYPLQALVSLPIDTGRYATEQLHSYRELLTENEQLRQEQLTLQARLLKFSSLEKENARLRALMDTSFKLGEIVLVAELVSINLDPYQHTVMVNKGARFGAFVGQAILDATGIAGQVVRVYPSSAEVMLITDPSHAIPIEVNRNGLRSIAVGSGQLNRLNLPFLLNNADIQVGDLLVTSGLGGVFPSGYPVAHITEISPSPGQPFAQIYAEPTAQLDRSREFLLVWSHDTPVALLPDGTADNDSQSEEAHEVD